MTLIRVERPNQSKRGMLYLVDLAGTEDAVVADKAEKEFKSSVQTNSDLVRAGGARRGGAGRAFCECGWVRGVGLCGDS